MVLISNLLLKICRPSTRNIFQRSIHMREMLGKVPKSFMLISIENKELMSKAMTSDADAVIIDLEDTVVKGDKKKARIDVAKWLTIHHDTPSNISVNLRINSLKSGEGGDDFIVCLPQIKSHINLVYPKVDDIKDIKELERLLKEQNKIEPYTRLNLPINLIIDVESAKAFVNLKEIVHYAKYESKLFELKGLIFGSIDYVESLGRTSQFYDPQYLDVPRYQLAQIAAAYDVLSIDMITDDISKELFIFESLKAYNMGYTSKLSLNSKTNTIINESMIPPKPVVNWAMEVTRKFESAKNKVTETIEHEGKTIGAAAYAHAKKIVDLVKRTNSKDK